MKYKCKRCGVTLQNGAGASAHLRLVHGIQPPISEHKDELEVIDSTPEVRVSTPLVIHRPTPPPKPEPKLITIVPNMDVVTDGSRIGIVEWHDPHDGD